VNAGAGSRAIGIALLCAWAAIGSANAAEATRSTVPPGGLTEAVVASCAGGAAIGILSPPML